MAVYPYLPGMYTVRQCKARWHHNTHFTTHHSHICVSLICHSCRWLCSWSVGRGGMGGKQSKLPVTLVKSNVAQINQFCECEFPTMTSEGERYAFNDSLDIRLQIYFAMLRYLGAREPRRTRWQKWRRNFENFFLDTIPLYCNPPCPKALITKLALLRNSRPSYTFVQFGPKRDRDIDIDYRFRLHCGPSVYWRTYARRYQSLFGQARCFYVECEYAGRIACVYLANIAANPSLTKLTLLYSHTNGVDLGLCIGYIVRLARRYNANVISYDYPGFGISGGTPSETGIYKSIESVYAFLTKKLCIPSEQIVAIGSSLGTTATIHLASKWPVRAVILQASFLSAYRVVFPFKCRISKHDQYENIEKIGKITVPTLFVHGKTDSMFSLRHPKLLRRHCPGAANIPPLYLPDCDHLGFEEDLTYWPRLHCFLHEELGCFRPDDFCCNQSVYDYIITREKKLDPTEIGLSIASWPLKNDTETVSIQICDECMKIEPVEETHQTRQSSGNVPHVKPGI